LLAIIGGPPSRFGPFVELYHRALDQLGVQQLPVGVHSPGYVSDTDKQARDELWPHYRRLHDRIGAKEAGAQQPGNVSKPRRITAHFYVGSPENRCGQSNSDHRDVGIDRFEMKYSCGSLPSALQMKSIEL